jgi:pyridinium-3,5-bisthiocarboxylic acid mononucleotide nickel chelatase
MKLAYFDCPAGISGDMLLGSLVDCGVSIEQIKDGLATLPINEFEITEKRIYKFGLGCTQIEVLVTDKVKERRLADIISLVAESQLPEKVKEKALGVFKRIGTVEAQIHGVDVETIRLHELGGQDTIIDVVGAFLGMEILGVDKVYASPLPLGTGHIQSAHGIIPLPAPATLALLEGVPVIGSELKYELVTPTGAAILTGLEPEFGVIPPIRLLRTGYGAGKMDLPIPNVLRLLLGEGSDNHQPDSPFQKEELVCIESNIDNMNPEIYSYLTERLFDAGALDVSLVPVYMKKNRPGTVVNVLCSEESAENLINILFSETTTLGARKYIVCRYSVERYITLVSTPYGDVNVKFSRKGDKSWNYAPEYDDCRRLAAKLHLPILKIYRAAEIAAEEYLNT